MHDGRPTNRWIRGPGCIRKEHTSWIRGMGSARSGGSAGSKISSEMTLEELQASVEQIMVEMDWGCEIDIEIGQIINEYNEEYAWDDVNHMELPIKMPREARTEEMGHINSKKFIIVKKNEAWRLTGKGTFSTKCVDTDKSNGQGEMKCVVTMGDLKVQDERGAGP